MCQVQSAPRPPAPDRNAISGYGDTLEEAVAHLRAASCMCTCAAGVPSFLCRVCWCWAAEVGTCEPRMSGGPSTCLAAMGGSAHWCAHACNCMQWDLITDDGHVLEPQLCEDGDRFVCRHSIVSGEHSEVQRRMYYRGDSQIAVRMWPPPRVEVCEKCGCHFGTYVRTCPDTACTRAGQSVMVVNDSLDMAVACVLRCNGHAGGICCDLHDRPDVCVVRGAL